MTFLIIALTWYGWLFALRILNLKFTIFPILFSLTPKHERLPSLIAEFINQWIPVIIISTFILLRC